MSPPRANLEQQGIYELLQGDSQELTFVYPKRGENRSAIIMKDWTGDGVSDAVGFVSTEGGGVRVSFLEKYQERWRTAASFVNAATQVDLVTFGDVNGDGAQARALGWGSAAAPPPHAAVSAYLYRDGDVTETLLGTYGEMAVTVLNGDGVSEVFTVDKYVAAEEEGAEALPAQAHIYAWQDGALQELHTASADNSITSYTAIHFGKLGRDLSAVVVDGAKADGQHDHPGVHPGGRPAAQLPRGVNSESYQNPFSRPSAAACTDCP